MRQERAGAKKFRTLKDIEPLLRRIRRRLEEIYGQRLKHVAIYGSFARGMGTEDSDIDVVAVLEGSIDRIQEINNIQEAIYELELESGELISIYPITEEELENSVWPLYRHMKEGVRI